MARYQRRHPRGAVKSILLQLLEERGADGLNAKLAVAMTIARGTAVDRTTLSSLLSRLKADGVVSHDGYFYRLSSYEKRPEMGSPTAHS